MKKVFFIGLLLISALSARAQEFSYEANMESRAALMYNGEDLSYKTQQVQTNFYASYGEHLSMRIRTRMYNWSKGANFFDASDYFEFYYSPDENWTFAAGKGDNRFGSFEYDQRPINFYYLSEFSNNVGAFRWCASAERQAGNLGRIGVQVAQSMYATDLIGYNLYLHRFTDKWSAMWSLSAHEYEKDSYMGMVAIGDEYNFGKFKLRLDAIDRFISMDDLADWTISARATWAPTDRLQIAFEYAKDVNNTEFRDAMVAKGSDINQYQFRAEYYPFKENRNIRLHACGAIRQGQTAPDIFSSSTIPVEFSSTSAQVGISWRIIKLHNRNYLK